MEIKNAEKMVSIGLVVEAARYGHLVVDGVQNTKVATEQSKTKQIKHFRSRFHCK
jgi:hypothetical protein